MLKKFSSNKVTEARFESNIAGSGLNIKSSVLKGTVIYYLKDKEENRTTQDLICPAIYENHKNILLIMRSMKNLG